MEVSSFSEIEEAFLERVQRVVWCNVATIDTQESSPFSRFASIVGRGCRVDYTHRDWFKVRHLTHNPYVSLAYIADLAKPVYVDCKAEWVDDLSQKQRIWQL